MNKRILLRKDVRRNLFQDLKKRYKCSNYKDLARILQIGHSGLKKWMQGSVYIPMKIIPENFHFEDSVLDEKEEGWGRSKGGTRGIVKLREKYQKEIRSRWSVKGGNNNIKNLERIRKLVNPKNIKFAKIKKREERIQSKLRRLRNNFTNKGLPRLSVGNLLKGSKDLQDKVKVPEILDENLAEEIGIHIGDGT